MRYNYKILNFDPQQGTITIVFEGYTALNFNAPFINGVYLSGQALDDYIQTLYSQVLPFEARQQLIQTITGSEAVASLVSPLQNAEPEITANTLEQALVVSVEPVKSIYYIGETPEAIITFDKIIGPDTFINIKLDIKTELPLYVPSSTGAVPGSAISNGEISGINGEVLIMRLGDTTARYKGPVYPGGLSYNVATISAKTRFNTLDNQPYIDSAPIQLISEPVPNA
jgi:hypothetical protein